MQVFKPRQHIPSYGCNRRLIRHALWKPGGCAQGLHHCDASSACRHAEPAHACQRTNLVARMLARVPAAMNGVTSHRSVPSMKLQWSGSRLGCSRPFMKCASLMIWSCSSPVCMHEGAEPASHNHGKNLQGIVKQLHTRAVLPWCFSRSTSLTATRLPRGLQVAFHTCMVPCMRTFAIQR